jgi:hypothetical protein
LFIIIVHLFLFLIFGVKSGHCRIRIESIIKSSTFFLFLIVLENFILFCLCLLC